VRPLVIGGTCERQARGARTTGAMTIRSFCRRSLSEKLAAFPDYNWPRSVARLNNCDVMLVKVKGEFVWHRRDDSTTSWSSKGSSTANCGSDPQAWAGAEQNVLRSSTRLHWRRPSRSPCQRSPTLLDTR